MRKLAMASMGSFHSLCPLASHGGRNEESSTAKDLEASSLTQHTRKTEVTTGAEDSMRQPTMGKRVTARSQHSTKQ